MNWWERFQMMQYGLLDKESGDGSGEGGDDGDGGDDPAASQKPDGNTIPIDVLPEELRGKSAVEVKFMLEQLANSASGSASEIRALKEKLSEIESNVNKPEPEPDPYEELSDEELIQQSPEAAVERILKRKGYVNEFQNLRSGVEEATLTNVGNQIDDFKEYEDDVRSILKSAGGPITKERIVGAYTLAVGQKALKEKEMRRKKEIANMNRVAPDDGDTQEFGELTGLEKDIFDQSGLTREEWEAMKNDNAMTSIKVPT